MAIDESRVRRIAELAGLELADAEVRSFAAELESILTYVETLDELPAAGREADVPAATPAARADAALPSPFSEGSEGAEGADAAVARAPAADRGHFRVPPVIEE